MACVYSIDNGKTYLTESDFKNYLKNNLEDLVSGKEIDLSKFGKVIPKSKVSEITKPTNQEELATMLEKRFGRNAELAQAEAQLFDLRADVWSNLTGRPKSEFYDRVSYGDEKSSDGLNQIIGEQGASRLDNAEMVLADLNVAREMEKAGKTPKEIHLATSWEKGVDGKWRFELPDVELVSKESVWDRLTAERNDIVYNKSKGKSIAELKKENSPIIEKFLELEKEFNDLDKKQTKLSDIIKGDLLKSYPQLKDIKVVFGVDIDGDGRTKGMWSKDENTIYILESQNELKPKSEGYSTLVHEIQHAIQGIEGFAKGGSPNDIALKEKLSLAGVETVAELNEKIKTLDKEYQKIYKEWEYKAFKKRYKGQTEESRKLLKEWQNIDNQIKELKNNSYNYDEAYSKYKKLAGEVESRNVQSRLNMSEAERKAKMLSETEDVSREQQIIIQNALQQKSAEGLYQVEAYHGSPYSFDKFTTDKMGTGEGAQAFGWGLYFTDLKGIAISYAKMRDKSENKFLFNGKKIENDKISDAFYELDRHGYQLNVKNIKKELKNYIQVQLEDTNDAQEIKDYKEALLILKNSEITLYSPSRNLYAVTLHEGKKPSEYTWLEWDKPMSDKALDVFKKFNEDKGIKLSEPSEPIPPTDRMTGGSLYVWLKDKIGDKEASLFLLENGIDGIKYPAESISRGATSDTARGFNYVVFDENAVSIKEKELFQKKKGNVQGQIKFTDKVKGFNNAVMSLFKTAKADTFVHEFSHLNFQDMLAMAKDNEQIKADVKTAIEFYNQHAKPSERIKNVDEAVEYLLSIDPSNHLRDDTYVKVHEAFANGFVEYLRNPDSNIPTALKEIYEVLKKYLADLAQYIAGSQAKLTPEMEAVYRRLFEPEFVNNLKETAENRSVEREAIEMEQPIVRYNDDIAKDAFSNFDTLEQGDRPTPHQVFKSKIEEWKKEGKTDSTFVMEQLNKLVDDLAEGKNKEILKDFLKTKRAEYEELADGKKNLRQRTRTLLENKGLSLDDKERLIQDDTASTYVKISFKELQKDVDEVVGSLTYEEVVQNEEAILDRIEETTDPKSLPYAIADYQAKKLKKGFDYLDELRRNPKKNAKEIVELENKLHKDLANQLARGTAAGRELAAQKFFDILTPQILVENIKRQREAERTEEQKAKLKEEIEILKEKVEKGVANEEIHQAIVDELEAKVEVLQERLTDYDKQISKLEAKIKEDKDQSKQSVIENLKERALGKTKNSKTLKVDKKEISDKKSELKTKLQSLINSNLYSEENPESPLQVLKEYIENHILEQQTELAKKVSLSDMIKHFEEEGLPIPPATIAEAYKKARVRLIQEGVNRKAIDADAAIDLTLEALEAKKDVEELKEEKKALQNKIKNGASNIDKLISEAVKGVKWKDRVVKYDRDAAEKEVVDKVIENNPDLSDVEKQAVEQRVKDLFREKTEQWTANQINRVERKGQPKKKRVLGNNIIKLANLISTGNFLDGVNEALAEELGLAGITNDQRTQIISRMDVIKSLPHGTLRDNAIEDLSAYIMSITNPQMFAHNIWTSTVYTEMLSNIVSSAQNATGLIVSFEKAITDTLLNADATYLKNFFLAFNKGMLRSALQKGYFKSNEHFDLAQSEGGFSPFRGSEYAGKYGKNLDSKRRRFLAKYRSIKTTYLGGKFITRLNEGIDNISYASASESAAYKHIKKLVKRENPTATKEEIENMVYERMFPIKPSEARAMAIKDLNESAVTLSFKSIPTEAEIKRVSFDIMQQARDEETKEIMERESLKATYRNKPSAFNKGGGVVEGFSAAYEWAMSGAKNSIKNSKLNQSAKNKWMTALNLSKILMLPFNRTPANIIEVGTHYAVLGGAFKIASLQAYKKGLKGTQDISIETEREYITQYQKDVAVRMAKGAALLTILPVVFAMLNEDKDDDELKDGVYGNSKNNPTKIKNSVVVGGKIIPLNFLGALAPMLAVLGAKSDLERDKKYTDVSDESVKNDIDGIDNYIDATRNWMLSVVKSTPFYGTSRTVESVSDFVNNKGKEGIGKMIGTQLAYSYLPSPRMINDVISWEYTKTPQPHGFVQGMIRGTYTPALIAMGVSKPMFDSRGREIDIRDKSFMSVGGVYKRLASEPNDKYDNILLNHKIMLPFMKAESYLKDGRELTPDEFYKFSKGVADKYNQMITNTSSIPKEYYIENEEGETEKVNVHGLKYILSQIKRYKNMSMDELEQIGSADLQADRELYKAIMDNYKTIIKQQMHTSGIEKNSYSNYEDRMLSEYEKENLEKNKKELRYNLKKP